MPLEQVREFDVAVIGGGTAGISAAVACARQGLSVCLIEGESFLGGMATGAQVGSICGLYLCSEKEEPIPVCGGFAQEFTARLKTISSNWRHHRYGKLHYLIYDVETFKKNCASFLYDVGVHCFLKSRAHSPVSEATQIKSISIQGHNNLSVLARTFIDCSGESRIVEELSHPILNPHEKRQAVSLVFAVEKMEFSDERQVALSFLRELSRFMDYSLSSYSLSHLRVALLPGSYCDHRAWFKLSFCCDDSQNNWLKKSEAAARSVLLEFFEFAKRQLSGLSHAKLNHIAPKLGVRTGPRPLGKIILRRDDILSKKKRTDAIARASWPIEFWGVENKPRLEFLEDESFYEIPASCLESVHYENFWFAGRMISADQDAIASARVMGICLQTGYAAGTLAAYRLQHRLQSDSIAFIQSTWDD